MKIISKIFFVFLLSVSANAYAAEITPLLGYRGGGEFVDNITEKRHTVVGTKMYGFIIGFPYEYGKKLEIYYSHQSSHLNSVDVNLPIIPQDNIDIPLSIDYLHIGGTAPIEEIDEVKTFVSGGLGFTYLSPDLTGLQSDLRASFSLGLGLLWPITERLNLRLETRGLATLFNSNTALFCNGGCSLSVNGSLFMQVEVFAGLAIRF